MRCSLGYTEYGLILRITNRASDLQMGYCPLLSVVEPQPDHDLFRQPIAPERCGELAFTLIEIWLGQGVLYTLPDHHQRAGAVFLDVAGEEQRLANAGVAGQGSVRVPQPFRG